MRKVTVTWLLAVLLVALSTTVGAASPPRTPATTGSRDTGVHGAAVLLDGRPVGRVATGEINCVGHAAGVGSAVYLENGSLEQLLQALGYSCRAGDSGSLAEAIADGRPAMMVYLHLYPPDWREPEDRDLSYAALVKKYGWSKKSWQRPYVFHDRAGKSLPLDYHAAGFNPSSGRWEWVTRARDKDAEGGYGLDSSPFEPAAANPDLYFPPERVLVSLACHR